MIILISSQHSFLFRSSDCTEDIVAKYFDNATLPEVNTTHEPNLPAFELIAQTGDHITMPPCGNSSVALRNCSLDKPYYSGKLGIACIAALSAALGIIFTITVFSCIWCWKTRARAPASGKRRMSS